MAIDPPSPGPEQRPEVREQETLLRLGEMLTIKVPEASPTALWLEQQSEEERSLLGE